MKTWFLGIDQSALSRIYQNDAQHAILVGTQMKAFVREEPAIMFDALIADIAKRHGEMHANDAMPQTAQERQAAYIFSNTQRIIMELVNAGVGVRTLELTLLYNWLRLATLMRGYDEAHFSRYSSDLEPVVNRLIETLKTLAAELDDPGPSEDMAEIGQRIQMLHDLFGSAVQADLPLAEIESQTAKATAALMGFTGECLDKQMHPGLLESAMLYYWLRASTITAEAEEAFFQKLERHWPQVVARVSQMTDQMLA